MDYEVVVPVEIALLFYILILGVIMYFVYLALFYFLFAYTKNPLLKHIFALVLNSLYKLNPTSWKNTEKNSKK